MLPKSCNPLVNLNIMSTIITIHGTFATGSNTGERWWQKGSFFEKHLRELLQAEQGEFIFEPFIWDGKNSEESRSEAGELLFSRCIELEEQGESYCLIGHSHGGSVISNALKLSSYRNKPFTKMGRWITIGTPFIETRQKVLLFSKLRIYGKSAYLLLTYILFIWVLFIVSGFIEGFDNLLFDIMIIIFGGIFVSLSYYFLSLFKISKISILSRKVDQRTRKWYDSRWLQLLHKDDEAVRALHMLGDLTLSPFQDKFAIQFLSGFSIFTVPFILSILQRYANYAVFVENVNMWIDFVPTQQAGFIQEFARQALAAIASPSNLLFVLCSQVGLDRTENEILNVVIVGTIIISGLIIGLFLLWLISLLLYYSFSKFSVFFSAFLSKILNKFINIQIKDLGYGSDSMGESVILSRSVPPWSNRTTKFLPQILSDSMIKYSDDASVTALRNLRSTMSELLVEQGIRNPDIVVKRLSFTGKELLHTSYFYVPLFRKLIAYAISQTDSFQSTEKLAYDPERDRISRWYNSMQS